ncbi:MAG: hypothetical protein RL651_300 [Pseudomonadota bacterium]|jgi:hypothetical protein
MFAWIKTALQRGDTGLPVDLTERIKGADIHMRAGDLETGPRVHVGFRGDFIFTRDAAEKRIRKGWPELTDYQVHRAVDFLEARVRMVIVSQNRVERQRKNWVHNY